MLILTLLLGLMSGFNFASYADEVDLLNGYLLSTHDEYDSHVVAKWNADKSELIVRGHGAIREDKWFKLGQSFGNRNFRTDLESDFLSGWHGTEDFDIRFELEYVGEGRPLFMNASIERMFMDFDGNVIFDSGLILGENFVTMGMFHGAEKVKNVEVNVSKAYSIDYMFEGSNVENVSIYNHRDVNNLSARKIFEDVHTLKHVKFRGLKDVHIAPNTFVEDYLAIDRTDGTVKEIAKEDVFLPLDNHKYELIIKSLSANTIILDRQGFTLSADDDENSNVRAYLNRDEETIFISGYGYIDELKWEEMGRSLGENNFLTDLDAGFFSGWHGTENFGIFFTPDSGKTIGINNNIEKMFKDFDGKVTFGRRFTIGDAKYIGSIFAGSTNIKEFRADISGAKSLDYLFSDSKIESVRLDVKDNTKDVSAKKLFHNVNTLKYAYFKGLKDVVIEPNTFIGDYIVEDETSRESIHVKKMDRVVLKDNHSYALYLEKNLAFATINKIPPQQYTGKLITPEITITFSDGTVLEEGRDYTLTYRNATKLGRADVLVKGKGDYYGSIVLPFSIVKKVYEHKDDYKDLIHSKIIYKDLDISRWYMKGINYAVNLGIMNGVGNNNFDTASPINKAMITTILHRLSKDGNVNMPASYFNDLKEGKWYTEGAKWSVRNGIAYENGKGEFRPTMKLGRQYFVEMLYNYANYKGYDVSVRADLSRYVDANKLYEKTRPAMEWAVAEAIIYGTSDTTLSPDGTTTRAEMATMLMRFIDRYDR